MGNTVTICFANNKGGSGKSTSCSNVGAALAGMGKKVLMVDGDMQLNLSLSFFSEEEVLEMAAGEKNLYYAIGHQSDLSDFIVHTKYENLDLVPSSTLMSSVEPSRIILPTESPELPMKRSSKPPNVRVSMTLSWSFRINTTLMSENVAHAFPVDRSSGSPLHVYSLRILRS